MESLTKFVDETFELLTGLGEMKVAEAIFLAAVDDASQTIAQSEHKDKQKILRELISHAYEGQNIIKICAHLPPNSNANKPAYELRLVADKIDSLIGALGAEKADDEDE